MTKEELFETMGGIDEKFINAAEEYKPEDKRQDDFAEKFRPVQRKRMWARWIAAAACLCLVAGFGAPKLFNNQKKALSGSDMALERPQTEDEHMKNAAGQGGEEIRPVGVGNEEPANYEGPAPTSGDHAVPRTGDDANGVLQAVDFYMTEWENKTLRTDLANALEKELEKGSSDKVFEILAMPYIDYDFVYEGKTLAKYYSDMCDERNLPEVLMQLIKEGDSLRYGTALYEGTAPNGEKWAQTLYEERIAFYGQDILNKYIVNGEFLEDQAKADREAAMKQKDATKAYKAAFAAYYRHLLDTLQVTRPADVKAESGLVLRMTAEEFRAFTADHIEAWSFSFVNTDGVPVPADE